MHRLSRRNDVDGKDVFEMRVGRSVRERRI